MMLRLLIWNVGVEVNGIDVHPLARCCRPVLGIVLTRRRIDPGTLLKQVAVQACIALGWRHKADGAVTVLVVVPVRQVRDPAACGQQIVKRAYRQFGAVWTSPAFIDKYQLPVRSCSNASGLSWSR